MAKNSHRDLIMTTPTGEYFERLVGKLKRVDVNNLKDFKKMVQKAAKEAKATTPEDTWEDAKRFKILGYQIPVLKGAQPGDRKFYTELHLKDGSNFASMGSSMPTYWLAALETYIKRGNLL